MAFIKTFKTPNSYYVFDVNSSAITAISEESYKYLNDSSASVVTDEINALKQNGYLTLDSVVSVIKHPYTDYLHYFLSRKLSKITLCLTQQCSFRCTYCTYSGNSGERQRGHSDKKMDFETAKKAMDFLYDHSVDSKVINIGGYGGEPLIEFELIKKIIKYARERFAGKELTFNITTNGTHFTEEVIKFLEENEVSLMISLDGPKEINDKNRVFKDGSGTYDAIVAGIEKIKKTSPSFASKMMINTVIDPDSDFDCINSIYIDGDSLKDVNVSSTFPDFDYDDIQVSSSVEYSVQSEYHRFLAILSHFGRYPRENISPMMRATLSRIVDDNETVESSTPLRKEDVPSGPCIPGQLRLFVNTDGVFFPCERVSETSPSMSMGNLQDGIDFEKAKKILNVGSLTTNECRQCWCFRFCDMCVKRADDGTAILSAERKLTYCEGTRFLAYSKIKNYLLYKEIAMYYQNQARNSVNSILERGEV